MTLAVVLEKQRRLKQAAKIRRHEVTNKLRSLKHVQKNYRENLDRVASFSDDQWRALSSDGELFQQLMAAFFADRKSLADTNLGLRMSRVV